MAALRAPGSAPSLLASPLLRLPLAAEILRLLRTAALLALAGDEAPGFVLVPMMIEGIWS